MTLAWILRLQEKHDEAEQAFRDSLQTGIDQGGDESYVAVAAKVGLAALLIHVERFEEALALVQEIWALREKVYPKSHRYYMDAVAGHEICLRALGRESEADVWKARLEEIRKGQ